MKKNAKLLSVFLSLILLVSSVVFVIPANAEGTALTYWTDNAATALSGGGTGTADDPYLVGTAAEWAFVANKLSAADADYTGKYYKLTADIDLSAHTWVPVSGDWLGFNLNGDSHKITGLTLNGGTYTTNVAMFHYLGGATVENLTLEGSISDYSNFTAPGGYWGLLAGRMSSTTVNNCIFDVNIDLDGIAKDQIGGVAGYYTDSSKISNSEVRGSINVVTGSTTPYVGGFAGRVKIGSYTNVKNFASVTVEVTGENGADAGGIVGGIWDGDTATFINCVNYGAITVTAGGKAYAGGIAGAIGPWHKNNSTTAVMTNCVNVGTLSATGTTAKEGGMTAYNASKLTTYTNCFTTSECIEGETYNADYTKGLDTCVAGIDLQTLDGARVRLDTSAEATSGIRFDSKVNKAAYDALTALDGVTVALGTIIAPTQNIAKVADSYDKLAVLTENQMVTVPYAPGAGTYTWISQDETDYGFTGAIAKIYEKNYDLKFTAVAYLTLSVGDWSFTFYANDGVGTDGIVSEARIRSVADVADLALDSGKYTEGTDAWTILNTYAKANDAQ
ncbi:MAG: hypothetical protein IJW55_06750 [Clostridia bacterium]|nr:hypothetical protein [Clostridia bacterium]